MTIDPIDPIDLRMLMHREPGPAIHPHCTIGSCQRHQLCMYQPCRAPKITPPDLTIEVVRAAREWNEARQACMARRPEPGSDSRFADASFALQAAVDALR